MEKSLFDSSEWGTTNTKVSILIPSRDMVHTQFSYSLTNLVKTSSMCGIDTYVFFDSSTILLNQREKLIERAKDVGSEYVLWLDSDMSFPSTTLLRLLGHHRDIIGCNYMRRSLPSKSVSYTDVNDWNSWIPLDTDETIMQVEAVGMGCILMKTSVFDNLTKPYFEFRYRHDSKDWYGEDFVLFEKLKEKGHKIFIDCLLSKSIKHIGTYEYGINIEK